jgi:hypothetical protein
MFKFLEMWVAYSANIESIMTAVMRLNDGETAGAKRLIAFYKALRVKIIHSRGPYTIFCMTQRF